MDPKLLKTLKSGGAKVTIGKIPAGELPEELLEFLQEMAQGSSEKKVTSLGKVSEELRKEYLDIHHKRLDLKKKYERMAQDFAEELQRKLKEESRPYEEINQKVWERIAGYFGVDLLTDPHLSIDPDTGEVTLHEEVESSSGEFAPDGEPSILN